MSQYTTQLRYIVEVNSTPGKSVSARCAEAAPKIFPENWEFFDETKKLDFETAFLRHFYMQEICCETVGLWKMFLEDWLFTNMPYYNRILSALATDYDFLNAYDFTEKSNFGEKTIETGNEKVEDNEQGSGNENSTTTDNGSGNSFSKEYDFPSNNIDEITDHITAANSTDSSAQNENTVERETENSRNRTATTERSNSGERQNSNIITRTGRAGVSPGQLMKEYIDALRNIYQEIFDSADSLFMGVW